MLDKLIPVSGRPAIPVIAIPKGDIILRTEVTFLYSSLQINLSDLIYVDDKRFGSVKSECVKVHLVDHNVFTNPNTFKSFVVDTIIDHHVDENVHKNSTKIIKPVGSCCTLIAALMRQNIPNLALDTTTKLLLANAIILDTVNLDPTQGRVTSDDIDIIEFLSIANKDELFKSLMSAKTNISSLSVYDLLRRDCKKFEVGGNIISIPSITGINWDGLKAKSGLQQDVERYCTENNVSALFITLADFSDDKLFRFIVLTHGLPRVALMHNFLPDLEHEFSLNKIHYSNDSWLVYQQNDVKKSRKAILPFIRSRFETFHKLEHGSSEPGEL